LLENLKKRGVTSESYLSDQLNFCRSLKFRFWSPISTKKGRDTMKKAILTVAALALSATAAFGFAKTTGGGYITGTPHDLSGKVASGAEKQICAFCHTPHSAKRNIPLWNRNDPTTTLYYNTSVTLTNTAKAVSGFQTDSITSFCMSCHDGVTAIGAIKNDPTNRGGTTGYGIKGQVGTIGTEFTGTLANIGSNMADDHPVGFNYESARNEDTGTDADGRSKARLNDMATVKSVLGERVFFDSGIGADGIATKFNQIECASCHKVHDDLIAPFLRTSNYMSRLCLACHLK
jgi:hypothetical protein